MTWLRRRVNLAGILILLAVAVAGFNTWQRFDGSEVAVVVRNLTPDAQVVRVIDGTSGRQAGTFAIGGYQASLLVDERLDVWFRDLSRSEEAFGRSNDFIVELLGLHRCELIDRERVDHRDSRIDVEPGGFQSLMDDAQPSLSVADRVADPCAGQAAEPRGVIANQTTDSLVIGSGLVLGPCSTRTLHPGDVAKLVEPVPAGAVRVRVPSVDAQDERWPLEPRTVVVSAEDVFDETSNAFGLSELEGCSGHVPAGSVIAD